MLARRVHMAKSKSTVSLIRLAAMRAFFVSCNVKRSKQFRLFGSPANSNQKARRVFDRSSSASRGYGHRWREAREGYLSRHPLCVGCKAVGRVEASVVVDHVQPHRGDQDLFWDEDNWQACCEWHHNVIKQRLEYQFAGRRIGAKDLHLSSPVAVKLTKVLSNS